MSRKAPVDPIGHRSLVEPRGICVEKIITSARHTNRPHEEGHGCNRKKSKKATTAADPPPAVVDDDENVDDLDSEAEMDSLISAVQTAQARGLIGTPLAVPCDAGSFFVARRERLRSCRGLYENAFKRGGSAGSLTTTPVSANPPGGNPFKGPT